MFSNSDREFEEELEEFEEEQLEEELEEELRRPRLPLALDLLLTAILTVAVILFVRAYIADTYEVPTGSMLETIQIGDQLVGEKLSYYVRDPRAGEVITFKDPKDPEVILIKRVIATEGQVIEFIDGDVYVDGEKLNEPYTNGQRTEPLYQHAPNLDEDITYPYIVPEGCVWVMGDNRGNSLDSRYFGAVPTETVIARALFIYWPFSDAHTF